MKKEKWSLLRQMLLSLFILFQLIPNSTYAQCGCSSVNIGGPHWTTIQSRTCWCCSASDDGRYSINSVPLNSNEKWGLHPTKQTVAQEGRSFCIVGEHIRATELADWDVLSGFDALLKHSLDIGNHIHPDDSTKMNRIERRVPLSIDTVINLSITDTPLQYNRPANHDHQPGADCANPYKVEVTEIHSHKTRLHNYLHIKVYADSISQPAGGVRCPTGKMKYLMLEVRDSVGLPVGHFTDEIPCDQDKDRFVSFGPNGVKGKRIIGNKKNFMPCMFTPKRAVSHPGIFLATVTPPRSPGAPVPGGGGGGGGGTPPVPDPNDPSTNDEEYFTEVHATWRFAQHTSYFVTQLHFAALIVEDATPVQYFTSRSHVFSGVRTCYNDWTGCCWRRDADNQFTCQPWNCENTWWRDQASAGNIWPIAFISDPINARPYGYIAQYKMLRPTKFSLGGWDLYRKDFSLPKYVNCHAPMSTSHYIEDAGLSSLPTWMDMLDPKNSVQDDTYVRHPMGFIGREKYNSTSPWRTVDEYAKKDKKQLLTLYSDITQPNGSQPATTYFGTKYTTLAYKNYELTVPIEIKEWLNSLNSTIQNMAKAERCPCPALPTTIKAELETKKPLELDGRRLHAVNMLIAWVVLVPIAMFSARYFKETYSRVYFMREFWWYTVHVLTLFTAMLFMIGSVFVLRINRQSKVPWSNEIVLHATFGYVVMITFAIHLGVGFIRIWNVYYRIIQIMMHWLFGMLEYMFAVVAIMLCAAIRQGFFNCDTFHIYCAFLVVQVLFHVVMDVHLRLVDRLLNLKPPRSYMPPPVMRLFHIDAPYAKFRMIMLILFCLTCCGFYGGMHYSLSRTGLETSCYEPEINQTVEVEV